MDPDYAALNVMLRSIRFRFLVPVTTLVLWTVVPRAAAIPFTFTGSGTNSLGHAISASATFDTGTAGQLTLTVSNTYDPQLHLGGADVLTGLYFNVGSVLLNPLSATLGAGSDMIPGTSDPSGIASHWGYLQTPGLVNGAHAGSQAIAATGLITGANTDFTGAYHSSSGYLAGPAYGIVGNAADTCGNLNHGSGGLLPLEANTVVYSFAYTGSINAITNVQFVYGTQAGEGSFAGQPPPPPPAQVPDAGSTIMLFACGVLVMGGIARRRR